MADTQPEVDLEKLRDEKCTPVAKALLKDMADYLFEDNGEPDIKSVALKAIEHSLNADLNIATEVSYLPQLILGVLSGLNATLQLCGAPIDTVRLSGIAKKLLGFVAEADIRMTNIKPEDTVADFAPVKEKIDALFAEEKLSKLEIDFIRDCIFKAFTEVNNLFSKSIENSSAKAQAQALGIDAMDDLTMGKLDSVLKAKETAKADSTASADASGEKAPEEEVKAAE